MFDDLPEQQPRNADRDAHIVRLSLNAPLRSTAPQFDSGHLPLFVAANEPTLNLI